MARLIVQNTFIEYKILDEDLEGFAAEPKKLRHTMARARSQDCVGREVFHSEQITKLNRVIDGDKEAVREARSPVKTTPAGTATPDTCGGSASEDDSLGWIELGSYGALPQHATQLKAAPTSRSELNQLKQKLEKELHPFRCKSPDGSPGVEKQIWADMDKGLDRNASNGSVSTMTSFEANRSRACSNGSMTDCWTENAGDEPVEFDLTIEEEPASHAWDYPPGSGKQKWRPKELLSTAPGSDSAWEGEGPSQMYQYGVWYGNHVESSLGYSSSPFTTPTPSPTQWNGKGYGKCSRGLPRESRHNRVPKNVNLQAEFHREAKEITTLMIRNIPNRYTQRELMVELEELGFTDKFDFLYSPLDKGTMSNVGYAFVNFKTAEWAKQCIQAFQNYRFKRHRKTSGKVAAVSAAHLQGLEANLAHYEKTAVNTAKMKQRRPVVLADIAAGLDMGY